MPKNAENLEKYLPGFAPGLIPTKPTWFQVELDELYRFQGSLFLNRTLLKPPENPKYFQKTISISEIRSDSLMASIPM